MNNINENNLEKPFKIINKLNKEINKLSIDERSILYHLLKEEIIPNL